MRNDNFFDFIPIKADFDFFETKCIQSITEFLNLVFHKDFEITSVC